jgi:hypothetical protein
MFPIHHKELPHIMSQGIMMWRHRFFFAAVLRLRPVLIPASRVRPSTLNCFAVFTAKLAKAGFSSLVTATGVPSL